ncbi:MAG: hypothetical protein Q8Q73_14335 [Stagnimonas sp.]|nr:hypothetical protein [Stagnimonas sp.]
MSITTSTFLKDYNARQRDILATEPALRAELSTLGISDVQADYDGVGDSGQIEDIRYLDASEPGRFIPVDTSTGRRVEDLLYALLNLRHGGWENNEGAYGSFRWHLADGTLEHDHNARFTDYSTSTHDGFEVAIGDEP